VTASHSSDTPGRLSEQPIWESALRNPDVAQPSLNWYGAYWVRESHSDLVVNLRLFDLRLLAHPENRRA